MCEFASFVLTKTSEYSLATSNSHTDIIEHYHLREMHPNGLDAAILKVEITPPADDMHAPIEKWNFRIDQDIRPEWFEPDEVEKRTRAALARRSTDERWLIEEIIPAGGSSISGYASTVTGGARSKVTGGDESTVTGGYASTVTGGDASTLIAMYWDPKSSRHRVAVAYVGEEGIEPGTAYILDENRRFVKRPE